MLAKGSQSSPKDRKARQRIAKLAKKLSPSPYVVLRISTSSTYHTGHASQKSNSYLERLQYAREF